MTDDSERWNVPLHELLVSFTHHYVRSATAGFQVRPAGGRSLLSRADSPHRRCWASRFGWVSRRRGTRLTHREVAGTGGHSGAVESNGTSDVEVRPLLAILAVGPSTDKRPPPGNCHIGGS